MSTSPPPFILTMLALLSYLPFIVTMSALYWVTSPPPPLHWPCQPSVSYLPSSRLHWPHDHSTELKAYSYWPFQHSMSYLPSSRLHWPHDHSTELKPYSYWPCCLEFRTGQLIWTDSVGHARTQEGHLRLTPGKEERKEAFYSTTHSTHLVTVIWRQTYGKWPFR